jgi:hypothetical protein
MHQTKHDDPSIAEVKAVLDRLQRISRKPHAAGAQTAEDDGAAVAGPAASAEGSRFPVPVSMASLMSQANASRLVNGRVLITSLVAVGAVAIFVAINWRPAAVETPPPVAAPQNPPPVPVRAAPPQAAGKEVSREASKEAEKIPGAPLQVASDFIAKGQVRAARDVLLRGAPQASADLAWLLARSYDPNYLVTLKAADAAPDVAQATRWYRTWYDIAVKQGLVADSVSLDRIVRSMSELNR